MYFGITSIFKVSHIDIIGIIGYNGLDDKNYQLGFEMRYQRKFRKFEHSRASNPYSTSGRGFIYIVQFGNLCKIGLSVGPQDRLDAIQREQRQSFDFAYVFPTDDRKRAERILHFFFRANHVKGEWFNLTEDQVKDFCTIQRYENGKFYCRK